MDEIYAEWQKLCKEFETARDAHFRAFALVNQKFAAIFQGTSRINPSEDEMSESEEAWKRLQNVEKRMEEFVKVHVYQKH
ncbi:MAG: hypothetical protein ACYC6G_05230 [Desulfobaccales bacterium]